MINKVYSISNCTPRKFENLTIYEKLYLTTLAREGFDEDLIKIKPISTFERKIAPTEEYEISIVKYLIENDVIKPHPDSPIAAFKQGERFPYILILIMYAIILI